MPVEYQMEPDTGLLVARASGAVNDAELASAFSAIVHETHGAALLANHLLVFEPDATTHEFDLEALRRLKDRLEALGKIYPGRRVHSAFVASGGAGQHLTVLMWKSLTELYPSIGTRAKLFADEAAARAWLMQHKTQAASRAG